MTGKLMKQFYHSSTVEINNGGFESLPVYYMQLVQV